MRGRMGTGLLAGVLGCGMAVAAEPVAPDSAEAVFARIDRDGSGQVDREEFRNAMLQRFARLDADGDGVLADGELPAQSMVAQVAADPSRVTFDQFHDAIAQVLARIDADGNGALSFAEFEAARTAARASSSTSPEGSPP